jgi:isopentenyl phosphate kinase
MAEQRWKELVFLKLGGSLITEKDRPHTPRLETIQRLVMEITAARHAYPGLAVLLGHGSGSFGHVPAQKYGTRNGVKNAEAWRGFAKVWREASDLDHLVLDALHETGLPAVAFPPSAAVIARDGKPASWDLAPIIFALESGLLPVVYGDVVFDFTLGGTILSTEELFAHLVRYLMPKRILLAGIEPGVWQDYPQNTTLFEEITPAGFSSLSQAIAGSSAADVTGGMYSKVQQSLELVRLVPNLEIDIFSGEVPGAVEHALLGERRGTHIYAG